MIKARIKWCSCRVENILTLGKLLRLWFCFLLHSIWQLLKQGLDWDWTGTGLELDWSNLANSCKLMQARAYSDEI